MSKPRSFRVGDTVSVNINFLKKPQMNHFPTGFKGLVLEVGDGGKDYGVMHPEEGPLWWFDKEDLTLVKSATDKSELRAYRILKQ